MINEIWRPINNYEETYEISSSGRVRRIKDYKLLYGGINKYGEGYRFVILTKNKKAKAFNVHRIVAQHFIPNPENKCQVNHIDRNKLNNHYKNLEWCSPIENRRHSILTKIISIDHIGNKMGEFKTIGDAAYYYNIGYEAVKKNIGINGARPMRTGHRFMKQV